MFWGSSSHALLTCRPAVHLGFFGRLAGSHPCTQPPPAYFKSSLSWKRCGGDVCFPQNSSSASFTSSPFSVDQPGPGPRDRLLLLCLLSHSTLPLHPLWGWLQLPGHWFSGLGSSLYSACGYLSCHCPSWDLHHRTFPQPPRGRSYRRAWSLVSFSGPFFIPLPRLLPLAVPGLPLTWPSSYLSVPSHPSCHQKNLGTLVEASSLPFFWEPPHLHLLPGC
ncbi:hypothetical protein mRhiFer1_008586 [Rhinolophus ferrumequinum]|uniref:Uncharacterized protein n=1 Tax=Rhinolophus ferrumequinum TaxID=59479 RepID=A0A7J7UJT6_RHIFE|nr:hypothetical protein mRhiFer1_008586 [Rhinolophus ferrumequinum]